MKPLAIKTSNAPSKAAPPPPPKQTTIVAAPLSGSQSNYGNPQGTGNVIVVDTGRLKQDLTPKNADQSASSKKKKKKKNKNGEKSGNSTPVQQQQQNNRQSDYGGGGDCSARILHNPSTNMVTIRNPAFGPPAPKPEPPTPTQQAAIIKVQENGMVTIRSQALQQAINAGFTPTGPKNDYVIKGNIAPGEPIRVSKLFFILLVFKIS